MSDDCPTVLVIFGGTGDLFRRKLAPSLMTLYEEKKLPKNLLIIGTGRSEYSNEAYKKFVSDAISEILTVEASEDFLRHFSYISGELHEKTFYKSIENAVTTYEQVLGCDSRIVWYCSIAPQFYADIAEAIHTHTTFLKRSQPMNSLLIEKPIGHDTTSCVELNVSLTKYFEESQITRIEHYLTKETLLSLPEYFTQHPEVYSLLQAESVAHMAVYFCETIGVEKRGAFYDSVGALRDVGQNHALEMLAHACMEYTHHDTADSRINARIEFLSCLAKTSQSVIKGKRLQYNGYLSIPGVRPHSAVETAYEVSGILPQGRWNNVPFSLLGGKRVGKKKKCVELVMRDHIMHDSKSLTKIVISIDPESVSLIYSDSTESTFQFRPHHKPKYQYVEEYARILEAGFHGSHAYSVSAQEVLLLWKITDAYTTHFEQHKIPLTIYEPDTYPFSH
ncbi:MAG: hypothetical protein RI911_134 [Candidatus Parcubacteria bacterium]|jgi:glucose-6-phosphate 1-dehydrogenase